MANPFRRCVLSCSLEICVRIILNEGTGTEIDNFNFFLACHRVGGNKNIFILDVSVYDSSFINFLKSFDDIPEHFASFTLAESLTPCDVVEEVHAVGGLLHHDEEAVFVLEPLNHVDGSLHVVQLPQIHDLHWNQIAMDHAIAADFAADDLFDGDFGAVAQARGGEDSPEAALAELLAQAVLRLEGLVVEATQGAAGVVGQLVGVRGVVHHHVGGLAVVARVGAEVGRHCGGGGADIIQKTRKPELSLEEIRENHCSVAQQITDWRVQNFPISL